MGESQVTITGLDEMAVGLTGFAARRAAVPNVLAKAQEIEGVIDESRLGALTIGSDEKG